MAAIIRDLEQVNADLQEQKERVDNVDFKMVTFSLAGKDYGVDIMSVKEIAKADKFTFVPNTASYVRGVYNLRGDIIPIIDLRNFFICR
ncbi:MAG: chemotaxis protein CheW [Brevinematales bacterium]|nr:chemotaxis protein CheW [Brevinematales bacterium]